MNPNPNLNEKRRQDFKKRQERFPWKKKNMSLIRLEIPPSYSAIFSSPEPKAPGELIV